MKNNVLFQLTNAKLLVDIDELKIRGEHKLLINTINAHSYNTAQHDPAFAEALLKGDILIPDGESIVKAIQWLRGEKIQRIAGWDLFEFEMHRLQTTEFNEAEDRSDVRKV